MASKEFKLTSPAISNDGRGTLPRQCTQEGLGTKWNISPPLEWHHVPEKAKTLAVVAQNVNAVDPSGHLVPQTHWVVVNIPATPGGLPEGFSGKEDDPEVMSEEFSGIEQGLNDWKVNIWRGPKWPNYDDRIEFKIYASDNDMRFDNTVTKEKLLDAIAGHLVGQAQFMATFSSAPQANLRATTAVYIFRTDTEYLQLSQPFAFGKKVGVRRRTALLPPSSHRRSRTTRSDWEIIPGGVMVQKRNLGVEDDHDGSGSSLGGPMIKINVSHALHYEIIISVQSTFGDVKKLLMKKTGLDPEQQRLFFNGREKEDEEHLHTEGVSDKTRLLLLEGQTKKEKKVEESRECEEMLKASKAVTGVRSEVDKLSEMVVTLEVAVDGGTKVSEEEFQGLTNLLMSQITKLDTIEAQGEAKLQRKAEVLRVQNFVDTLESLKARNNGNAVKEEKLPRQKTSLEPEEQGRFSRGKEKENEEHLQMEDVKKMKLEESRARIEMMKASEAVDAVRSEVDGLSERVAALEVALDCGYEISEKEFQMLNELLMKQLLKLDTIEAHGEAKLQRKAEVLRVQKFVDTVDSLKARNSDPFGNGVKAGMEYSTGDEELHEEEPIAEKTSIDSYVAAAGSSSQHGEGHTEELLPNGSFPETELEKLVVGASLPEEDALLLARFFSIHPSMLLTNPDHSDQFISFGYSSLVRLLRFLEHHTPASVDHSRRLQFLKMLRDLGSLGFNEEWLAQTKEMILGSLLSFQDIDTQLQGLVSSEEVLMKKLKFLESKRSYLSFSLDRLSKEMKEVECSLTDVRQKVYEAQEVRRKKDVHFGF